ncbi:MAG: hypothetical protein ABEH88_11775 [Halobacteriales archaeon]
MDLPVWGVGVIAIYSLLQIPAVILIARYCEVDSEDLPTPPMRARWRSGNPQQSQDSPAIETSTPGQAPADSNAPDATSEPDDVRCTNCGLRNDPSFDRCRRCVVEL